MSYHYLKNGLLCVAGLCLLMAASCLKSDDPPPAEPNPDLTNHYCNDPNAVNYNRGFPGIPDNSVCTYPVDSFVGQWLWVDSVFHPDSSFNFTDTKTLAFQATEDTLHSHMEITGLCNNPGVPIQITADKYGTALIDSVDKHYAGQFFCSPADTVSGRFRFPLDRRDTMMIELTVHGPSAGYHKGKAHRL